MSNQLNLINGPIAEDIIKSKKTSGFKTFLRRILKNKPATIGFCIFMVLVILAILAPYIIPYEIDSINMANKLQPPSAEHIFGTDQLGRDIFSRILFGGRYSLSLGVFAIALALLAGILIGSVAGFYGKWVDALFMRILDVVQALPTIFLAILMSAVLGAGYATTIIALAIPNISSFARLIRAQFLKMSQQEYVEAATSIGCSKLKIMLKHILPNAWQPLIVASTMGMANTVLQAAALSFIGLGIQAPIPEWGAMLSASRDFMRDYPWMVIFPGIFIFITVLSLNLFGDGTRDALDPRLKS